MFNTPPPQKKTEYNALLFSLPQFLSSNRAKLFCWWKKFLVLRGFHKINFIILIVLLLDLDSKNVWVFYVQAASKVGKLFFPFQAPNNIT